MVDDADPRAPEPSPPATRTRRRKATTPPVTPEVPAAAAADVPEQAAPTEPPKKAPARKRAPRKTAAKTKATPAGAAEEPTPVPEPVPVPEPAPVPVPIAAPVPVAEGAPPGTAEAALEAPPKRPRAKRKPAAPKVKPAPVEAVAPAPAEGAVEAAAPAPREVAAVVVEVAVPVAETPPVVVETRSSEDVAAPPVQAPRARRPTRARKPQPQPEPEPQPGPQSEPEREPQPEPERDVAPLAQGEDAEEPVEGAAPSDARRRRRRRRRKPPTAPYPDGVVAGAGEVAPLLSAEAPAAVAPEVEVPRVDTPSDGQETRPAPRRRRRPAAARAAVEEALPGDGRPGEPARQTTAAGIEPAAVAEGATEAAAGATTEGEAAEAPTPSRRRRRRRRGGGAGRQASQTSETETSEAEPVQLEAAPRPAAEPEAGAPGTGIAAVTEPQPGTPAPAEGEPAPAPRRHRRRRGSGNGAPAAANGELATSAPAPQLSLAAQPSEEPAEPATPPRRKRRRGKAAAEPGALPAAPAAATNGLAPIEGPADRKRPARRARRVRPERQPIPPSRPKTMLITVRKQRTQIGVMEEGELVEHYVASQQDHSIVGNIYLGRVQNVLPGMEAAFINIGEERNAVIYAGEVTFSEDVEGPSRRIEKVLKSGQPILAQVTKDPMGSKGARLSAEISLAGRYVVLVPDAETLGVSRRLPDDERTRLREIGQRLRPGGYGLIIRTAAKGVGEPELADDIERLVETWHDISEKAKDAQPPSLIYAEPELVLRAVRDLLTDDVERVIIDDEEVYRQVRDYVVNVTPSLMERMEHYQGGEPLFDEYHVNEQIRKGLERRVGLPSGGHLVIDRTEAMTIIDVNTGRFVGKSNLEETVVKTNLEAAAEVAKQLRLRDIGGIIVIDFIDMLLERNREELVREFRAALARDKTRTQVYGVSELGLVQMTRKRVSEGLLEAFSEVCPTCEGRGIILTDVEA